MQQGAKGGSKNGLTYRVFGAPREILKDGQGGTCRELIEVKRPRQNTQHQQLAQRDQKSVQSAHCREKSGTLRQQSTSTACSVGPATLSLAQFTLQVVGPDLVTLLVLCGHIVGQELALLPKRDVAKQVTDSMSCCIYFLYCLIISFILSFIYLFFYLFNE